MRGGGGRRELIFGHGHKKCTRARARARVRVRVRVRLRSRVRRAAEDVGEKKKRKMSVSEIY